MGDEVQHEVTTASELSDYLIEAMHAYDEEWDRGEDVPEPPRVVQMGPVQLAVHVAAAGLVFTFPNGAEFQLTIMRTAEAHEDSDIGESAEQLRAMSDERALRASGVIKKGSTS
jgi:hypothetical protein